MSSRAIKLKTGNTGKVKTGASGKVKAGTTGKTKTVGKASGGGGWLVRQLLMAAFLGLVVWVTYEYVRLPQAVPLLKENPKTTALMAERAEEARQEGHKPRRVQTWVGLSSVSKYAIDAVLLSEDASFYVHEGVDKKELENALEALCRHAELVRCDLHVGESDRRHDRGEDIAAFLAERYAFRICTPGCGTVSLLLIGDPQGPVSGSA